MPAFLDTAGERLEIDCHLPWTADLVAEGGGGELRGSGPAERSVEVTVEADHRQFATRDWQPLTRGAWRRNGEVVIENACTSGYDLHLACTPERARFTYRWRPPPRDRAAARLLRSRSHLLARAVLMQFPALWWAGARGRVPLHASGCTAGDERLLLSAAGGAGRSTLILQELGSGGSATGDNLAVADGTSVWGLVEPMRIEGGGGRRMPHGRHEATMPGRIATLLPDRLVVLERGTADDSSLEACDAVTAARSLVTSTYMAGELRRYWAFAATLSAGTCVGPPQPPITDVASAFASKLPCFSLVLGRSRRTSLSALFATATRKVEA